MITAFVGSKGGVGNSVTALTTASSARRAGNQVLLVDLTGDIGVILGTSPDLPGVAEMTQSGEVSQMAVQGMSVQVDGGGSISLLPRGQGDIDPTALEDLWESASRVPHLVCIVDAGRGEEALSMVASDHIRRAVMTECDYQSLHRTRDLLNSPIAEIDDMVVMGDSSRALGLSDIEAAAGRRATAYIERRREIARWADAGLILDRVSASEAQTELWDAGPPPTLTRNDDTHRNLAARSENVSERGNGAGGAKCGTTVKTTQMPCLLSAGHRGNHRSVL